MTYRSILATLNKKNIEIVQTVLITPLSIAGGGSASLSFPTMPQTGNTILFFAVCDQIRNSTLSGSISMYIAYTGSAVRPARIHQINASGNVYTLNNISGSVGTFRVIGIEIKNAGVATAIGDNGVSGVTTISSTTGNYITDDLGLIFVGHSLAATGVPITNGYTLIAEDINLKLYARSFTAASTGLTATVTFSGNTEVRQITYKISKQ